MRVNKLMLLVLCVLSLVPEVFLSEGGVQTQSEFPANDNLAKRNVALRMKGFRFTSGLTLTSKGQPNCDGSEIAPAEWYGSGFIVKEDGTVVTNYHVATKGLQGEAIFSDGGKYAIKHIKVYKPENDIAILKIMSTKKFPVVLLGNSEKVSARDMVLAVGNPLGMGLNITEGKVSQVVKKEKDGKVDIIRHTAQIAPGNSGGALYKGREVIGVNASINLAGQAQFTGFNNAIPINKVKILLNDPKYNRSIHLQDAFPSDYALIEQKAVLISALNGQAPAAAVEAPGFATFSLVINALEDIVIALNSPGSDLALNVLNAQGQLIGCGDIRKPDADFVILSSSYPQEIFVRVINYDKTPANFGLKLHYLVW